MLDCREEAALIRDILKKGLPQNWDGKECIQQMREANAPNWRQMEWIGWYLEWRALDLLQENLGGGQGPVYGTTRFDYQRACVWDLKAHVSNSGKPWAILNDSAAIRSCIADYNSVGFVVACGPALYNDIRQTFKQWHYETIGSLSKYVLKGLETGRRSRRRKTVFVFSELLIFRLNEELIAQGLSEKWIRGFQEGLPNSNTRPRPAKIQIHLGNAPPAIFL